MPHHRHLYPPVPSCGALLASCLLLSCGSSGPTGDSDALASTGVVEEPQTTNPEAGSSSSAAFDTDTFESSSTNTDTSPAEPACGNSVVEESEVCDDGSQNGSYGACDADCLGLGPRCGDGIIQEDFEDCDTALGNDPDACNVECQRPGSVLDHFYETIELGSSASPRGAFATQWNGRVTAVFGASPMSVWEFDTDSATPVALRTVETDFYSLVGAAGLSSGALVVADGGSRRVHWLDDGLKAIASFEQYLSSGPRGDSVGMVAFQDDSTALAAVHLQHGPNRMSGFWVRGFDAQALQSWADIEVIDGTDDYYAHDLERVGEQRAVLLSASPGGHVFRIYSDSGVLLAERSISSFGTTYRDLCSGPSGFFVVGSRNNNARRLLGFDQYGEPTYNPNYEMSPDTLAGDVGCVARERGPLLVQPYAYQDGTTIVDVAGYDGTTRRWSEELIIDGFSWQAVDVFVEEDRHRAWVFVGGQVTTGVRFLSAHIIAI